MGIDYQKYLKKIERLRDIFLSLALVGIKTTTCDSYYYFVNEIIV
jgi:hypothetical protein